jgi:hypothetical protein
MRPDDLDTAIREELRSQARLAPAAAPVKAQVLLAARALGADEGQPRGLRAWVVPMLAAAAVLLVTLGAAAGSRLLNSDGPDRTPPAVSSTPATPTPRPSTAPPTSSPTAAPTSKPTPAAKPTSGGGRPSAAASSQPVDPPPAPGMPQNWHQGLKVAALPHTPGLCPDHLTVGHPSDMGAPTVSVPGEPAPLWLLTVTCLGGDSSHPMPVEVFRYHPSGPQLVQTLAYRGGDPAAVLVTSISVDGARLRLGEQAYAPGDSSCCRSLRFSQDFTWDSAQSRFVAGPQVDTLQACTGEQLTVTSSPLTSESNDARGVLLGYANHSDEPCTLSGYPAASVVDSAGQPLADAARTPAGFFGGLSAGNAPRLVLFGDRSGSAVVEWAAAQHGSSQCHPEAELLSTPPGATATASYGVHALVCDLQVHPVVSGATGRQPPTSP